LSELSNFNFLQRWNGKSGFDLEHLKSFLSYLGNPQNSFNAVHVAGTNGKGTTSCLVASILAQNPNLKIGLHTSPHFLNEKERCVINGYPVEDDVWNQSCEQVIDSINKTSIPLSYFEATVIATFLAFKHAEVDCAVIEVGLGGRLDATNVITRVQLSIITSIGYDHMLILGSTLQEIAREKSGIIKGETPVLVGLVEDEIYKEISTIAHKCKSPIKKIIPSESISILKQVKSEWLKSALNSSIYAVNACLAIEATKILGISEKDILDGLNNASWPGRLELISKHDTEICIDGAHNVEAVEGLNQFLSNNKVNPSIVLISLLDKEMWREVLQRFKNISEHIYYYTLDDPRALSFEKVSEYALNKFNLKLNKIGSVDEFLLKKLGSVNSILISGSLKLVALARQSLKLETYPLWSVDGSSRENKNA
jgi:dihydrofolate synthase / folylpolyglutamate synthase